MIARIAVPEGVFRGGGLPFRLTAALRRSR